ncbi:uncharacterized protein LOC120345874 isoform X1 [Styela clava]
MEVDNVESLNNKVLVEEIPACISREKLMIYFQRQGDVQSVVFPLSKKQCSTAVIKFHKPADVKKVLKTSHNISRKLNSKEAKPIKVSEFKPEIFVNVTTQVDKEILANLRPEFDHGEVIEETGLGLEEETGLYKFIGELYQIRKLYEILNDLTTASDDRSTHKMEFSDGEKTSGAENERENVGRQNKVQLDKDIFKYMKNNNTGDIWEIMNYYGVHTTEIDGAIMLEFRPDRADEGIRKVQDLYIKTQDSLAQTEYELPSSVSIQKAKKCIDIVETEQQDVIVCLSADENTVSFIGGYMLPCVQAMKTFKSLIGDESQPSFDDASRSVVRSQPIREFEKLFEFTYPGTGGLTIRVVQGDIAKQSTDAIVNAANKYLDDGAGVTGAIFRAGGYAFNIGCQSLMESRNSKKLKIGEVVHTDACGRLRCKHVLHVVGPKWHQLPRNDRIRTCKNYMEGLCWKLITYANNKTTSNSIAIPAISTGIYGVPMGYFCEAMLESVNDFHKSLEKGEYGAILREVRLVGYSQSEANEIADYFKRNLRTLQESEV